MKTEFVSVTFGQEILNVHVRHIHLLASVLERVQTAVRILFEEVEPRQVVGDAIRAQVAEQPNAGLFFGKKEAAEIAGELLNSGAQSNKIIIRAQVVQL